MEHRAASPMSRQKTTLLACTQLEQAEHEQHSKQNALASTGPSQLRDVCRLSADRQPAIDCSTFLSL